MIIGSCSIKLIIYESHSLKDKRQVVKSIIGRLRSRHNISIGEVELYDSWQTTVLGIACVTNDTGHANEIISKIIKFIDQDTRVEILDYYIEIL